MSYCFYMVDWGTILPRYFSTYEQALDYATLNYPPGVWVVVRADY